MQIIRRHGRRSARVQFECLRQYRSQVIAVCIDSVVRVECVSPSLSLSLSLSHSLVIAVFLSYKGTADAERENCGESICVERMYRKSVGDGVLRRTRHNPRDDEEGMDVEY